MRRSLSLSLYLLNAGRGRAVPAGSGTLRPRRGSGPVVWLATGPGIPREALEEFCTALVAAARDTTVVLTPETAVPDGADSAVQGEATPADQPQVIAAFLDHWQPDVVMLLGQDLPPALILACKERSVPIVLAAVGGWSDFFQQGLFRRQLAKSLLPRFDEILAADEDTARSIRDLGGLLPGLRIAGRLEDLSAPLNCNEAERATLAAQFGTRGVWLAADCPPQEEDAVLAAHAHAMRMAHRMLLIAVPSDLSQGPAMADRMTREGFQVALRSQDEEPEAETQVYVADTEGEYGLWYRLAPVTYLGGTLSDAAANRDPMEAAALGSALISGSRPRGFAASFAKLTAGKAIRTVRSPASLADAVAELIAPDRAASLAHNAWRVSSDGAEVIETLVGCLSRWVERARRARSTDPVR